MKIAYRFIGQLIHLHSGRIIGLLLLPLVLISTGCQKEESMELFHPDFDLYVLLPLEGLGDRSFVDLVYEGVEGAAKKNNFNVRYIVPDSFQDAKNWIRSIPSLNSTQSSSSLIVVAGNQYAAYINELNGNFGSNKVLLLASNTKEYNNLASIAYRSFAPSYIGGYLSAKLIKDCKAVTIAAFDAIFLTEYQQGFKQGVTDAGGQVSPTEFLSTDFRGFSVPDYAFSLANKLLSDHQLIFALATGSNFGTINAARSYNDKRYVIGVDADQSWMGLNVVTGSVVVLFDQDILEYIDQFSQGKFKSGNFTRSLADKKTEFLMNKLVMGETIVPQWLIEQAIQKEKEYSH